MHWKENGLRGARQTALAVGFREDGRVDFKMFSDVCWLNPADSPKRLALVGRAH